MPNWCDNSMRLYHEDKTKIDALEAEMNKRSEQGDFMAQPFQHLRPNPTGEWQYDWSCENWGTKWDANIIDWIRDSDNELTIYCDTAWSPPTTLYQYLTEQGWEVDAYYHESGMAYCGKWNSSEGDEYYEYDVTDPDSIESLPEDLVDFAGLENAHREWLESELHENWADKERTDWYEGKVNPVHVGWYEVTTAGWDFPQFSEWTGDRWISYNEVKKWRGLAEEPNETEVD